MEQERWRITHILTKGITPEKMRKPAEAMMEEYNHNLCLSRNGVARSIRLGDENMRKRPPAGDHHVAESEQAGVEIPTSVFK